MLYTHTHTHPHMQCCICCILSNSLHVHPNLHWISPDSSVQSLNLCSELFVLCRNLYGSEGLLLSLLLWSLPAPTITCNSARWPQNELNQNGRMHHVKKQPSQVEDCTPYTATVRHLPQLLFHFNISDSPFPAPPPPPPPICSPHPILSLPLPPPHWPLPPSLLTAVNKYKCLNNSHVTN